jgi:hypothetical protein
MALYIGAVTSDANKENRGRNPGVSPSARKGRIDHKFTKIRRTTDTLHQSSAVSVLSVAKTLFQLAKKKFSALASALPLRAFRS